MDKELLTETEEQILVFAVERTLFVYLYRKDRGSKIRTFHPKLLICMFRYTCIKKVVKQNKVKNGEVNCWLLTGFIRMDIAHLSPMLFAKVNNPCGKTVTLWSYTELYRSGVWHPLQVGSLETCCV